MRNHFDLTGRRALVTGSSRGIGRAIALALAEYGADLCVHYHGRHADAEEVAKKARGFGVNSVVVQADIGDVDGPAKIAEAAIAGLGGIDILVLNASMEYRTPWNEILPVCMGFCLGSLAGAGYGRIPRGWKAQVAVVAD